MTLSVMAAPASRLTLDTSGRPVVELALLAKGGQRHTFRFLIDTGSSLMLLGSTIPPEFCQKAESVQIQDATGQSVSCSRCKAVLAIGERPREIDAARVDLEGLRRWEDEPVDGVLGMSALRGNRLLLDPRRGQANWDASLDGIKVPIGYGLDGAPVLTLVVGLEHVLVKVDTGDSGTLTLPTRFAPEHRSFRVRTGMAGVQEVSSQAPLSRVGCGSARWENIPADFSDRVSTIGVAALFGNGPVELDFVSDALVFRLTGEQLAWRRPILELPVIWDRSQQPPTLRVAWVPKGSPLEGAKARPGDVIGRVGNLEGHRLTRGALMALLATGEALTWELTGR
jgi:hypothetical protein